MLRRQLDGSIVIYTREKPVPIFGEQGVESLQSAGRGEI